MFRSKAKATKEEAAEIVELHRVANNTPVIAFSGAHAATGGASADARRAMIRRIDEIAAAHGLEPQRGEWGFDPTTREFLSQYPIAEARGGDDE